ncbi:uncharacterized protein LOC132041388 isoform X3 [Lycium ferocissimum]|uniref:uncharacterized protein LOC132041388 isoform X3 n=1 Tax=Lycium ferocissimum TaxID=112874 RepID=UPI002815A200|nr:uncharacterized protein LOC132041388 isoform X3 [Lycium ferocissimum]
MSSNRQWMYKRLSGGLYHPEFVRGVQQFIEFAMNHPEGRDGERLRCPCNRKKCQNRNFENVHTVHAHLLSDGFKPDYHVWYLHGENEVRGNIDQHERRHNWDHTMNSPPVNVGAFDEPGPSTSYHRMIHEAAGPSFDPNDMEEFPNPDAQKFYDMIDAANQEVWPGCETHSQLSAVARLLHIKAEHHLSERCFDDICQYLNEIIPPDNLMPKNFYETKKLMRGMNMPVEKIHSCVNACMIYWGEDSELIYCKFCSHPRYKPSKQRSNSKRNLVPFKQMYYFPLTPRLQRLYASEATASHMRWHAEHEVEEGVMRHCSDAPAWKHFDRMHPSFATESRNVRLGLCTDGFQPFGQTGQQYSSWPVIVTPYNLPPWMCMKDPYLFLSVIVPGPKNPKQQLDVFLQPLIAELKNLWNIGVDTYDISKKQNFKMRAALMWTISDFPAYSMLSGWSTAGRLACPYCMENSDAFTLTKGGKQSWFDNHRKFLPLDHPYRKDRNSFRKNKVVTVHPTPVQSGEDILREIEELGLKKVTELGADIVNRQISKFSGWKKRSIFWDLPYWSTNLIRHNLDVMHIEKNFFENVFNTVLDVDGKTKDNPKSREDLKEFCRRPELHAVGGEYPKAIYTLNKESKKVLCEWVKNLKFPDGYVSNMGRCVDMKKHKLFGMKSHDCHVFMQRLIPIAFRELLPTKVWEALTEMSLFFRDLTSTVIREEDMVRLQKEIPEILCKLERILPPSFFDSMEHLPVHLAYEARLAGPVQNRWMYPFERNLRNYKHNVRNKAHVEGSICNAYLVEEASSFCSHYFEPHVYTRHRKVPQNDDGGTCDQGKHHGNLSIFTYPGKGFGEQDQRYLTEEELDAAHIYILLNCVEVQPYVQNFIDSLRQNFPQITEKEVDRKLDEDFASWFKRYVRPCITYKFPPQKVLAAACPKLVCAYRLFDKTWILIYTSLVSFLLPINKKTQIGYGR